MIIFQTERLVVRRLTQDDLPGFHQLESDPDVLRYADGERKDELANATDLAKCIGHYSDPGFEFCIWALVEKVSSAFVGTCALVRDDGGGHEIGYRLIQTEWGKGFGKEACNGLVDYCIDALQLSMLTAHVDSRNVASVRILEQSRLTRLACDSPDGCEYAITFRWTRDGETL
ncbi:GNAT family N-acetyltransferase [bacterium]|nr:GNAT family N-acetyltransferase [bacterium]